MAELKNDANSILPLSIAKLQTNEIQLITKVGWTHQAILMQKVKDHPTRFWYMQKFLMKDGVLIP